MDWLPQKSELNIIKAAWDHRVREWNKRPSTLKGEFWNVLEEPRRPIPEDYLKNV